MSAGFFLWDGRARGNKQFIKGGHILFFSVVIVSYTGNHLGDKSVEMDNNEEVPEVVMRKTLCWFRNR